jgi:hypothetical protein
MTRERSYFRIRYPLPALSTFFVGDASTKVLDVAEYGISFRVEGLDSPELGQRLVGRLEVDDRWTLDIDGDVVWINEDLAAIRLREPIPYKVIIDEQLLLRARYSGR